MYFNVIRAVKFSSVGVLILLTGCVTNEQNKKEPDKVETEIFSKNEKTEPEHNLTEGSQFFVVAKIKSVNDQPEEFLEFKEKRFDDEESCQMWMNKNSTLVTKSLSSHVFKLKQGYFIDSVKCLKTTQFFPRQEIKDYNV